MTDLMDRPASDHLPVDEVDRRLRASWSLEPPEAAVAVTAGGWFLAALLLGAGAIHLAMAPTHVAENAVLGGGFLASAWIQIGLALLLVTRPSRWVVVVSALASAAMFAVWLASRTVGLPFDLLGGSVEEVAAIDATCAVLEAAALIFALFALVRPRAALLRMTSLAAAAVTVALIAATAAIASPSATHHHEDDKGFSALQNGQMAGGHSHAPAPAASPPMNAATRGQLAAQLALTVPLIEKYPTVADAKRAGYWQAGPFSPGLGVHFNPKGYGALNGDGVMDAADIGNPMLIYAGLEDSSPLAGFMYMAFTDNPPSGFAGPLDQWHFHTNVCIVNGANGLDTPFGADSAGVTKAMCAGKGGSLIPFTGYMVHAWTVPGYESPLGTFSDLNPRITCPDGTYHVIPLHDLGNKKTVCKNP